MPREAKPKAKAASSSAAASGKTGRSKKDPNAPKRGLSAYMFFSQAHRERVKTENPEAGFGELGRLLGAKWKEMSDSEKKPYIDMAEKDKARAEQEKANYKKSEGGTKKKTTKKVVEKVEDEDEDDSDE